MKNKYLFLFVLLFVTKSTMAQSDISMATHWYNRANYNPASIARTDYLYLFSNVRQQWVGVEGAPQVINIQVSEYVHSLRSAFGVSLVGDKTGATQTYNPMLTYAYRIAGKRDWSLSLGLAGGIFMRDINGSVFDADNNADNALYYGSTKTTKPDVNTGVEYQNNHFIVGLSSTHIFSIFQSNSVTGLTNHRYGYFIYKNTEPKLYSYSAGLQVVNRQNLTVVEGTVGVRFKRPTGLMKGPGELFDLGLTLRTSRQMSVLFGMNVLPDLRLGYTYNQTFRTGYAINGTHEIVVEYRIPQKAASTKVRCGNQLFWYH